MADEEATEDSEFFHVIFHFKWPDKYPIYNRATNCRGSFDCIIHMCNKLTPIIRWHTNQRTSIPSNWAKSRAQSLSDHLTYGPGPVTYCSELTRLDINAGIKSGKQKLDYVTGLVFMYTFRFTRPSRTNFQWYKRKSNRIYRRCHGKSTGMQSFVVRHCTIISSMHKNNLLFFLVFYVVRTIKAHFWWPFELQKICQSRPLDTIYDCIRSVII